MPAIAEIMSTKPSVGIVGAIIFPRKIPCSIYPATKRGCRLALGPSACWYAERETSVRRGSIGENTGIDIKNCAFMNGTAANGPT